MVQLLVDACHPSKIILFGSVATGTDDSGNDLDVLIVKDKVESRAEEVVRLNQILSPLRLPVDLLVVDSITFQDWSDTPGNVYYEARATGKTLYEEK